MKKGHGFLNLLLLIFFCGCQTNTARSVIEIDTTIDFQTDSEIFFDSASEEETAPPIDSQSDAGLSTTETDAPATEEWTATVFTDADTPYIPEAPVKLFIPSRLTSVPAIMVFSNHGIGGEEYLDEEWRTSAVETGYALMEIQLKQESEESSQPTPWQFPDQAVTMFERAFETLAEVSGHREVATAPFVIWGHSAGGFLATTIASYMPERTIGFVDFHGSVVRWKIDKEEERAVLYSDAFLSVPGLVLIAEYEGVNIGDPSVQLVAEGRALGARWSLTIEKDARHWTVLGSHRVAIPFTEDVIALRVPVSTDGEEGPIVLNTLCESDGWLGTLVHNRVYDGEDTEEDGGHEVIEDVSISSYADFEGDPAQANWFPTQSLAEEWLEYEQLK